MKKKLIQFLSNNQELFSSEELLDFSEIELVNFKRRIINKKNFLKSLNNAQQELKIVKQLNRLFASHHFRPNKSTLDIMI